MSYLINAFKPVGGGWARPLNWVAHPLGFGFSKGAVFDFVFSNSRSIPSSAMV
jgi:hypothetical protein